MAERAGAEPSPFQVLGLPEQFDLDAGQIETAWMRRAARAHPDRGGNAGAGGGGEEAESLRMIAKVNEAHRVLADPERRAEALLVLKGGASREQDNALPEGFLGEIFGVRQDMEEALASSDAAQREEFERWSRERRAQYISSVREQFARLGTPGDPAGLRELRRTLNAWRYIERMIEQLRG